MRRQRSSPVHPIPFHRHPSDVTSCVRFSGLARALVAAVLLMAAGAVAQPPAADAPAAADGARLPGPAYPDVLALAAAGQSAQALVTLDEDVHAQGGTAVPLDARLLRARLLAAAGRPDESDALWQAIAATPGIGDPLRDLALHSALSVAVQAGRLTAASAALDALAAAHDGRADPAALVELAQAYVKANDGAHAAPLFERALALQTAGGAADTARLGLAAIKAQSGDAAGALALLREAELHFASPATFGAARAAERRIAASAHLAIAPFTEDQYASLIGQLSDDARYHEALDLIDEWAARDPKSDRADEMASTRVGVLYASRADDKAMAAAARFLHDYPRSTFVPDVRTVQFRVAVREQRTASVITRGRALWLGRVKGVKPADRFSLGRLLAAYLVGVGRVKEGLAIYRRLYGEAANRDDRADILWRAGVAAVRVHAYSRAAGNLEAAIRLKPGVQTERICRYWLGVAQLRLGRRKDAIETLTGLVHDDLYDYYGAEAQRLLEPLAKRSPEVAAALKGALAPSQAFPSLALDPASTADPRFVAAEALARAGLSDEAADLARQAALILMRRLRLLRIAWGIEGEALTRDDLSDLAVGLTGASRLALDLVGVPAGTTFSPPMARLILNLLLLANESLPGGGHIRLSGGATDVFVVIEG
ncbi:MAG: hypothetical protein KGN76_05340, partial [Acidobacteriota bacterium]|nr:hypothetical protein [Acidobacteriota bacterium]